MLQYTTAGLLVGGLAIQTGCKTSTNKELSLITHPLGETGFNVTSMGFGGQGALQWTPEGVRPEKFILKAMELGINYFDTSNVYEKSQLHYGKAFREGKLIPGTSDYDEKKRRSIFLASKTLLRNGKGTVPEGMNSWTNGDGLTAVDDLKRTLSQVFGDGKGNYPKGAYLDLFQFHDVKTMDEIATLRTGLDAPDPTAPFIGAMAAMRDYRDGTNLTGLNPEEEQLIRHLGVTGHTSAPMLMEMMQQDEEGLLETILMPINANDTNYLSMQYNALPVAVAKKMGVIAMKVFSDGAMFTKPNRWTKDVNDVVQTVADSSRSLVQYTASTPGVATTIMGIGHINDDPEKCQLHQNLEAAQIYPGALSQAERKNIEKLASKIKEGQTNWFQAASEGLTAPTDPALEQKTSAGGKRTVRLTWNTAYAADASLKEYVVVRDGKTIATIDFKPQTTKKPYFYEDSLNDNGEHSYEIAVVDEARRKSKTGILIAANRHG